MVTIVSACPHDWVACGEFHPTGVPAYAVVCTLCRVQSSERFGRGRPRIDWDEFWSLVGETPPVIRGRNMAGWKETAVVDPEYPPGPMVVREVVLMVNGRKVRETDP